MDHLWMKTYRGNYIETLKIKSGVGKDNKDYKVSMKKDGVWLDMRERCSAGQKVLASLIIRLAMADAFCTDCGVLALDEPTAHLDAANMNSLAKSLIDIIRDRQDQSNFQLIVITHSENFVEQLGRSEYVDEFYKVERNTNGHSVVNKCRVDQLFT